MRKTLSLCGIEHLGLIQDALTEIAAQVPGKPEIRFPPDHLGKFALHIHQFEETDSGTRFKLQQHVDIAVRTKIVPQHRAEKGQFADMMPPTERGDLFGIDQDRQLVSRYSLHCHYTRGCATRRGDRRRQDKYWKSRTLEAVPDMCPLYVPANMP